MASTSAPCPAPRCSTCASGAGFLPPRAVVLIGAALYQVAMLLADLAYAALDPRVRL